MILEDLKIKCIDCGKTFDFTVQDQKYFISKNWCKPRRCMECRKLNRDRRKDDGETRTS